MNVNNTQKNIEKKNKETSRMITREEFEKTRQYGLEKLKDPEIRAVFMRLKDKQYIMLICDVLLIFSMI